MAKQPISENFDIAEYWHNIKISNRLSKLCSVVSVVIMMLVSSVNVERSFSLTGQILLPQGYKVSDDNYKGLAAIYFNSKAVYSSMILT